MEKMDHVNIADQDEIISYFTGKTDTSDCISSEIKLQLQCAKAENSQQNSIKAENSLFQFQVLKHLQKHEIPTNRRSKCLRHPKISFQNILDDLTKKQTNKSETKKYRISHFFQRKVRPIIIVPSKTQIGSISIHNVEKFLLEGVFDDKCRFQNPHIAKTELRHQLQHKTIEFQIINNGKLLKKDHWKYVVFVFVQGFLSQFQGWQIDHHELLSKVKGYCIKYQGSGQKCHEGINAKLVLLDRDMRNEDFKYTAMIWRDIEEYLFTRIA